MLCFTNFKKNLASVLKIDFTALWIVIQSFWPEGFPTFILLRPSCHGSSGGVRGEEVGAAVCGRLAYRHEARRRELMTHWVHTERVWAPLRK